MELKVRMNIPDDTRFIVRFNNKTTVLDQAKPADTFEFAEKGTFMLEIEQKVMQYKINILNVLFYLIISFIQVPFYVLLSADFGHFHENIKPYRLKMAAKMRPEDSGEIVLRYIPSSFIDIGQGVWKKSELKYENTLILEGMTEIEINKHDFNRKLFDYLRKVLALFVILEVLFLVIGISAYQKQNLGAVIFIVILIAAAVTGQIFAIVKSVQKKNLLLKKAYINIDKS